MSNCIVRALRAVIAIALVGSVVVQVMMVALLWLDTDEASTGIGVSLVIIGVLGVGTLQIIAICIWRLLTMVGRGTVFSHAAFRYVDIVISALVTASILTLGIAVAGRFANHAASEDVVAPGLVGLISGFALVVAGVGLVVYVMRSLLAQAVSLDSEAKHLKAELEGVI